MGLYIVLKMCALFMYTRIKYKDDGRDLVSGTDFFGVHVAVSIFNAWMTYLCIY